MRQKGSRGANLIFAKSKSALGPRPLRKIKAPAGPMKLVARQIAPEKVATFTAHSLREKREGQVAGKCASAEGDAFDARGRIIGPSRTAAAAESNRICRSQIASHRSCDTRILTHVNLRQYRRA
jgi:hypothetical protein